MAILTRAAKGSPLSHDELDNNFIQLEAGVGNAVPQVDGKILISATKEANIPENTISAIAAVSDTKELKISGTDTTPKFLSGAFNNSGNVVFSIVDSGANETIKANIDLSPYAIVGHNHQASGIVFEPYSDLTEGNVQLVIQGLRDKIQGLQDILDTDDETLDTLQEVKDFILENRGDLDTYVSTLEGKVDRASIYNALDTISTTTDLVLDARQGKVLNDTLTALQAAFDTHNHDGTYALEGHDHNTKYSPVSHEHLQITNGDVILTIPDKANGSYVLATVDDIVDGKMVVATYIKNAHGLTSADLNKPLNILLNLAKGDTLANAELSGILSEIPDSNRLKVILFGSIDITGWGLDVGKTYYLSTITPGELINEDEAELLIDGVLKPVLNVISSTQAELLKMPAVKVGATKLSNNLTVTGTDWGAINDGTTLLKGTSFDDIFKQALVKRIAPTYFTPTLSLSVSGASNSVEAGTSIDLSETASYNKNDGGNCTAVSFRKGNTEEALDVTAPFTHNPEPYIIGDEIINYQARASYEDGPVKSDNLGVPSPDGQVMAGTVDSNTVTFRGLRYLFYGVDNADSSSASIRLLSGKLLNPSNGTSFTITIPVGAEKVSFTYPSTLREVTSVLYRELQNMDIKGSFTTTLTQVEGVNGFNPMEYEYYEYVPVEPYDQEIHLDITI